MTRCMTLCVLTCKSEHSSLWHYWRLLTIPSILTRDVFFLTVDQGFCWWKIWMWKKVLRWWLCGNWIGTQSGKRLPECLIGFELHKQVENIALNWLHWNERLHLLPKSSRVCNVQFEQKFMDYASKLSLRWSFKEYSFHFLWTEVSHECGFNCNEFEKHSWF